jgi:hypothetical protein
MLSLVRDDSMTKFERNEDGKYVCPECEREYEKYNSLYRHYNQKHGNSNGGEKVGRAEKSTTTKYGNSNIEETVDRAVKSVTKEIKKIPKTVTKEITGSNSDNELADDEQSNEIEENTSLSRSPKTKTKRVRLKPVEPPVKKSDKKSQKATENEEETETETWIIPGILKGSSNKKKANQEDVEKKWLLIEGLF